MRRVSLLALFLTAFMPCVLKAQDEGMKIASLRLAIQDLMTTFGGRYPQGADYLRRLDRIEAALSDSSSQDARATAVQDYPKLAQLWWQAIGDASSGAKSARNIWHRWACWLRRLAG